jgi:hypothetical protein
VAPLTICNTVFLRHVANHIPLDQEPGRATQLCDELDRIFGGHLEEALDDFNDALWQSTA